MMLTGTLAAGVPFILTLYAQQVLGYSALKFGLGSVVLAVAVTVGAIVAQTVVLRVSFRPVAASSADRGLQSAFLACVVLAGIGMVLAFLLPGRVQNAP
jgi:hypothetical protein